MSEQQSKPKITQKPYRQTKYFLSSLNTHLGHILVNRLRNEAAHPENPHQIIGTVTDSIIQQKFNFVPQGVRKVIEKQKVQFFHDVILNSDVIIYDLNTCNLDEAEQVILTLKINQYKQQKTLICISNVMTWAKTKPKEKKQGDQEEGDENPAEEPDTEQQEQPLPEGQQKKVYTRFTQKDYNLRRPHPEYEKMKSIQTLCLAAGTAKNNLKTYVLCTGILYGAGQNLLRPYFMQARLQDPQSLSVFGKGKNRIPMVHLYDLVTYIEKVVEKRPPLLYILALDQNPKPTQKKIIEAISKGIGTGKVTNLPINQSIPNIDLLTLNLRMKPTMYFSKLQQQQAAIQVEEGVQIERFKFNWQAKQGVQKNIEKLRQQFNKALNLKQQKIFLVGPPGSGKSYLAKRRLSKKYNLPHLHIQQVIEQVKSLKSQFGQEILNAYNEKKQSQVAVKQEQYDANKQKWKKIPKQLRQPLAPFDPNSVDVRLSDEQVYKCFKWRLSQNDCLNRGYLLDGFPKKYEDAKQLFMGYPALPEGQQPDENTKKIVDERLIPTKFILLNKADSEILEALRKLPEDQLKNTSFTEIKVKQRLKKYRKRMNNETGDFVLQDFFKQNKVEMFEIKSTNQAQTLLQSIIKPISISESQQSTKITEMIQRQRSYRSALREQMTKKQQIIRNIQTQDYRMKKENQQNEQRQILDKKSLALRKYLDVNLVPILSQGILNILKQFPKDPVDKLAEFLFKNSLKVPNPDPSTFEF